jgi:hypothetical protein
MKSEYARALTIISIALFMIPVGTNRGQDTYDSQEIRDLKSEVETLEIERENREWDRIDADVEGRRTKREEERERQRKKSDEQWQGWMSRMEQETQRTEQENQRMLERMELEERLDNLERKVEQNAEPQPPPPPPEVQKQPGPQPSATGVAMSSVLPAQSHLAEASGWTQTIKKQMAIISRASKQGNFAVLIDQANPKAVALLGGRQQAIATIKAAMDELTAQGLQITECDFGRPRKPIRSNGKLFSIVPTTTVMTLSKAHARIRQKSFMLAISTDNGANWSFTDGTMLTPAVRLQLFPDLPSQLKLPTPESPSVEHLK